jgi:uncharacterized protein (TIGR00369 family)
VRTYQGSDGISARVTRPNLDLAPRHAACPCFEVWDDVPMSDMVARNPGYEGVVRSSFAQQGLMAYYGAELTRVEPGSVEIEVEFRSELTQQQGFFHGGVTTALVDTACGYSALTLMPAGSEVLSVEFKINLFAPARGNRLVARGRVLRSGRTITVCQGDAYAATADGELHCATMVATMLCVDLQQTPPSAEPLKRAR